MQHSTQHSTTDSSRASKVPHRNDPTWSRNLGPRMVTMSWAMWVWSLWAGTGRGCCPWEGLTMKVEGFRVGERAPPGWASRYCKYSSTRLLIPNTFPSPMMIREGAPWARSCSSVELTIPTRWSGVCLPPPLAPPPAPPPLSWPVATSSTWQRAEGGRQVGEL